MGSVGYQSHQEEAATSYRGHHQQRGGRLGEVAKSCEGDGKDRGEHDGLKQIVANQRRQRHHP